jgi:hypothetical protein
MSDYFNGTNPLANLRIGIANVRPVSESRLRGLRILRWAVVEHCWYLLLRVRVRMEGWGYRVIGL